MEKIKWRSRRRRPPIDNEQLSYCSISVLLYSPSLKLHSIGWFDFEMEKWVHIADEEMKDFIWTDLPVPSA